MKKRAILVVSLLCMLVLAYVAIFGMRRTRAGNVQNRVEILQNLVSQNLRMGASSEQVTSFLDVQHLEHSKLTKSEFMRFNSHNYANENVIVAIKRNTWVEMWQKESIQLVFVFNEKGELVRFDVFPVYTGL